MDRFLKVVVCAAMLAPLGAHAATQQNMGQISGYFVSEELDGDADSVDGDGFGVKGWFGFGAPFVHFEWQSAAIDLGADEEDVDQMRLGGGISTKASDAVIWFGKAEYINIGVEDIIGDDEDGFGVHAGAIFLPGPAVNLHASLGYLSLNESDGLEYNLGAGFNFNQQFGAFIDYRTYMASFDASDVDVIDLRVGVTYSWGM